MFAVAEIILELLRQLK